MHSYLTVLFCFILSFILHAIVHRTLVRRGQVARISVLSYAIGGVVVALLFHQYALSYPLSSLMLFILLSLVIIYFYFALSLGGETPASMILASYAKKKRQTKIQLVSLFTDHGLLWKRLDDLEQSGCICHKQGKYMPTAKGKVIIFAISVYQFVFHRSLTE